MTESEAKDGELYLVDGSGFIFRAYYAMAYSGRGGMTNPAGVPVGAVYGFTNMLLKMLKDYHAPYMAVIFDAARKISATIFTRNTKPTATRRRKI